MPSTTRWALPYPASSDPPDGPAQIGALATALDDHAKDDQGTLASRPVSTPGTPGKRGRYYYATDEKVLYRDTGTSWIVVGSPNQGLGLRGYAEKTSNQTITEAGGEVDVSGLSVSNVVVLANRRIKITVRAKIELVNASGILGFDGILKRGSTPIGSWAYQDGLSVANATLPMWYEGSVIESPSAGTYTYKASFLPFYQDHLVVANGATNKAWITVEDIGPATLV